MPTRQAPDQQRERPRAWRSETSKGAIIRIRVGGECWRAEEGFGGLVLHPASSIFATSTTAPRNQDLLTHTVRRHEQDTLHRRRSYVTQDKIRWFEYRKLGDRWRRIRPCFARRTPLNLLKFLPSREGRKVSASCRWVGLRAEHRIWGKEEGSRTRRAIRRRIRSYSTSTHMESSYEYLVV